MYKLRIRLVRQDINLMVYENKAVKNKINPFDHGELHMKNGKQGLKVH